MKGVKKILLVTNDPNSALKEGLKIAHKEKCNVTVIRVVPKDGENPNVEGVENPEEVLTFSTRDNLDKESLRLPEKTYFVKTKVEYGTLPKKIIEMADKEECDLIVLGSKKINWFRRLLQGSFVNKIIYNAPCPVLVLNEGN